MIRTLAAFLAIVLTGCWGHGGDPFVPALPTGLLLPVSPGGPNAPTTSGAVVATPAGPVAAVTTAATNLPLPNPAGIAQVYSLNLDSGLSSLALMSSTILGAAGDAPSHSPTVAFRAGIMLVAFVSTCTNLIPAPGPFSQVYLKNSLGEIVVASGPDIDIGGNQNGSEPHLAADGTAVVFTSMANNLGPPSTLGRRNVFRRRIAAASPLTLGPTELVSGGAGGIAEGNGDSFGGRVSSDDPAANPARPGAVVFMTAATNLGGAASPDTNGVTDLFVRSFIPVSAFTRIQAAGIQPNGECESPDIVVDGSRIAFSSIASNFVPGGGLGRFQVYSMTLGPGGGTSMVSLGADGLPGDSDSGAPRIVVVGGETIVLFLSTAFNLVPGAANGFPLAFAKKGTDPIYVASRDNAGRPATLPVSDVAVAATASQVICVFKTASVLSNVPHSTPQSYVNRVPP